MKILIVSPHLAVPAWGAGQRTYYLTRALASAHNVSFLAPEAAPEEMEAFLDSGPVNGVVKTYAQPQGRAKRLNQLVSVASGRSFLADAFPPAVVQPALDELLAADTYDMVFFESVCMAGVRLPSGVEVVIDQHNIEHELLLRSAAQASSPVRRWFNRREGRLLRPIELERCGRADLVLVTSERERALLADMVPAASVVVVPNGVEIGERDSARGVAEVPGRVVFVGTMTYYPNVQAAEYFAAECWPLIRERAPQATWQIIGRNPPASVRRLAELPGVEVLGGVPDVAPHIAAAQVTLAPLLSGSGTRLKILEALAMEKAMVSTTLGCEGIAVTPDEHLVVADTPRAMADAVVELFGDERRRRRLGRAGQALVEAEYSWERCGSDLLAALGRMRQPEAIL